MKFYSLENAPARSDDVVFKQSPVGAAIGAFFFLGLALMFVLMALHVVDFHFFELPAVIAWICAVFIGIFGLVLLANFQAAMKPSDWLLRVNASGVLIKYRSYLNYKLPAADIQIVELDYSEIAWVRNSSKQRRSLDAAGSNAAVAQTFSYLELKLAGDHSALPDALRAEQNRESTASSRWGDDPVELSPEGIIRVRWRAGSNQAVQIVPNLKRAIKLLSQHVATESASSFRSDLTTASSAEDLKGKAQQLMAGGDKFGAVELVKRELRCSTTEAMRFIAQAQSGNS